jgi:hypothetical protein
MTEDLSALTHPASIWFNDSKNGVYSVPCLVSPDFTDYDHVTTVPIPDGMTRENAKFDPAPRVWEDYSTQVLKTAADAAKQAQATAELVSTQAEADKNAALETIAEALSSGTIDDTLKAKITSLYPAWTVGTAYTAGGLVLYDGKLYKCLQDGTATDQTTPTAANYMWAETVKSTDGDNIWVMPTGYQNAYAIGDVVLYSDGKYYKSLIAGNTQVPGSDTRYWVEVSDPTGTEATAE